MYVKFILTRNCQIMPGTNEAIIPAVKHYSLICVRGIYQFNVESEHSWNK